MKYIEAERLKAEIDKIVNGIKSNCDPNPLGTIDDLLADSEIETLELVKDIIDKMKQEHPTPPGIEKESQKKGKQKPADKIEPENTPIEGKFPYNNSSDTLEDEIENIWGKLSCQGLFTATKEGFSEVAIHFANYLKKQKPAEWSVEDERMRNNLIELLIRLSANTRTDSTSINRSYPREIDWLKSLTPQPKQEWSEEDEWMLKQAIYVCHQNGYTAVENWLKSLRPQSKLKS